MNKIQTKLVPIESISTQQGLEKFLQQPMPVIAEAITGALEIGSQGMMVAGARLAQGALKGKFLTQLGREINSLIEKGKIPEDYAKEKYGFQTLTELLKFIDEEDVDEDRMLAMKALFYVINKTNREQKSEILNYQLFKLGKKLSASQIIVLRTIFDSREEISSNESYSVRIDFWSETISKKIGHEVVTLITQDAEVLITLGFIKPDKQNQPLYVYRENGGLTDLGMAFCNILSEYDEVQKV